MHFYGPFRPVEQVGNLFVALAVCNMLKDLHLSWSMPNGVALWALDEERIRAMSEAGCHYVIAAIESGNQRVLKEVIRKPLNLKKGIEICKTIKLS